MTGEIEDITEWAMSRYHWHQNGASAEALRQMIFGLAEKYDFTADERVTLGNALQAFVNELQTPSGKVENGPTPVCCSCWTGPAVSFNPPLCRQCIELAKRVISFPSVIFPEKTPFETISRMQREMGERCPSKRGDDCVYPECTCDRAPTARPNFLDPENPPERPMPCKMCQHRGKDWEGSDPKCAFVGSFFTPDNWNCATANAVRDISGLTWEASANDLVFARRHDDQSAAYISVPHIELESGPADGLFIGWYKNRGRTESMWLLGEGAPRAPTENDCLAIIAAFSESS